MFLLPVKDKRIDLGMAEVPSLMVAWLVTVLICLDRCCAILFTSSFFGVIITILYGSVKEPFPWVIDTGWGYY
jgi:hypothetical protein